MVGTPEGVVSPLGCLANAQTPVWVVIFVQVQAKEVFASMTSVTEVRDSADIAPTVWNAALESLGNDTAVRAFRLVTVELLRQLSNLRFLQEAAQGLSTNIY